jgi:hypothetical protein
MVRCMNQEPETESESRRSLENNGMVDPYSIDYDAELEMDRWFEEEARAADRLREDAEEAIWYALQIYGDPVSEEVRTAAVTNLIDAHYAARNAGDDSDSVFGDYGLSAWRALHASLPSRRTEVFGLVSALHRAGKQRPRSSRRHRSTRTRRSRSPSRSSDADPHLRQALSGRLASSRVSTSGLTHKRGRVWPACWRLRAHLIARPSLLHTLVGTLVREQSA